MPGAAPTNPAARIFAALACDLRVRILAAVNRNPHRATNAFIATHLGESVSTIGKAVTVLADAGLLRRDRYEGARSRNDGRYILTVTPLAYDLVARVVQEREILAALAGRDRQRAA